jgi:hypothetical protein
MGATMTAARSERLTRAAWIAAAALAALAVFGVVWQPALEAKLPDEAAGALIGDSVPAFNAAGNARMQAADRIIANNVFAATRRAPGRRFSPRAAAANEPAADAGLVFDPTYATEAPSLLGTVLDALGDRALILAPAVDSSARFYRVGERVGPYRVRRIEARRVMLDGPTGRIVLELFKPNEARP